jgi:hypothetical protein
MAKNHQRRLDAATEGVREIDPRTCTLPGPRVYVRKIAVCWVGNEVPQNGTGLALSGGVRRKIK